jgi:uncharacterized membrane protein
METIEKEIEVDRSVRDVYNQWTLFEEFPRFMEGVKSVQQLDDTHLHWEAEIAGRDKSWDAVITDQEPDHLIAWRNTDGAHNNGRVEFEEIDPGHTRVSLTMSYEPEGAVEEIGDALGLVSARISGDLKRFKEFIENKSAEPDGWRGVVRQGQMLKDDNSPTMSA